MNSKQLLGTIILFSVTMLIFPALVSFIITGIWAIWVIMSNADGLAIEDKKYDQNAPILSTKIKNQTELPDEGDEPEPIVYSALEERKSLLKKDIT